MELGQDREVKVSAIGLLRPLTPLMYNRGMKILSSLVIMVHVLLASCGGNSGGVENAPAANSAKFSNTANSTDSQTETVPSPSNRFSKDDIAKLKWIEGSWKGMDGENPFYERYKIEETAMVVEQLQEDGTVDGEPGRFELKNGEFGKGEAEKRSAASEIGDGFVQFVPGPAARGNMYRFERKGPDTWHAILEWKATAEKQAQQKVYVMERMK